MTPLRYHSCFGQHHRYRLPEVRDLLRDHARIGGDEDDDRRAHDDVQQLTDRFVAEVDEVLAAKEKELLEF